MTHRLPRLMRPRAGAKPKVLLVDDHQGVLEQVSAMLADDFDVVDVATDGRQALDMVHRVDPDVIVLDINMPGLDGFQTIRALEQAGSRTPVVFLSMVDAEEQVSEAFRCGARGYVLKSRVSRDLESAIDHAIGGRMFVPSLTSMFRLTGGGGHAMLLHGDVKSFLDGLAAFFDLALLRGDATCVIAPEDIREGLAGRLRTRGWDVGGPSGHRRYLAVDAAEAMNRFMQSGLPDKSRLAEIAAELDRYRLSVTEGTNCRLAIFGNMAMLLSAEGNTKAAIALEHVWNALTLDLPFFTVCGYATSCFQGNAPDFYPAACAEHGAVSHTTGVNA